MSKKVEVLQQAWGIDFDVNNECEEEIYVMVITDSSPDVNILGSWIRAFWHFGFNILKYLRLVLVYTDDFFTHENVSDAIKWAEDNLNIGNQKMSKYWNRIRKKKKK